MVVLQSDNSFELVPTRTESSDREFHLDRPVETERVGRPDSNWDGWEHIDRSVDRRRDVSKR